MQIATDSAMQANKPGHGMIKAGQHDEKILQTANYMINYHLGFLISIKRGLTLWRKNAQQIFFPFAWIFEGIKAMDYPYRLSKT